jgi:acetylornithine/succinyldiaminopimelate/putrescine aminotransferase
MPAPPTATPEESAAKRRILELAHEYTVPGRVETFRALGVPLVIGRREGYRLWDLDGHGLIDLHLNGGVFNLGHRHPEIVQALVDASAELDIGNHHFPSAARAELAELLARVTPGELHYTVFATGGSEAIDIAVKTARQATGRRKLVAVAAGYHGRTGLSGAAGDDEAARYFLSDLPGEFEKVPFDDLAAMEVALADGDVAAVLMETIPATSGFPIPGPEYLPGVKALCERHGSLYIADEVQTGLGRTGAMWGVESFGVEPDLLVTGKGLSGGVYPIAATVMTRRVAGWLTENPWGHVSTFGGAELGCRVAQKVIEITQRPETVANVARVSRRMLDGLAQIRDRCSFLAEIRCRGLVFGLRFDHPAGGVLMSQALYARGVWAMFAGFDRSVIQWKPGLLLDDATCEEALACFESALGEAKDRSVA